MAEQTYTQEEANQFIIEAHTDLETVKARVADTPDLVHTYNPETIESALGAAGHMGRRDIAQFLLDNGAELELATAAMMGMLEYVREKLEEDSSLALSGGAHRIPVTFHAAMSGDPAMMQLLIDHGAEKQVLKSIFGAVMHNKLDLVRWMLEHGANTEMQAPNGQTPLEFARERGMEEMAALLEEFATN